MDSQNMYNWLELFWKIYTLFRSTRPEPGGDLSSLDRDGSLYFIFFYVLYERIIVGYISSF